MKYYLISLAMFSVGVWLEAAGTSTPPAALRFENRDTKAVPDFQKHIVPLLGRLGCNSAKCHGSFQGQAGFRLSLFGFDFAADHAALTAAANTEEGARLKVSSPEDSLIVLKPTEQTDHEGGERFAQNSWEHHLLLRWIESGAKGAATTQNITSLEVQPAEIVFRNDDEERQLNVIAVWDDGSSEDVTGFCRFRSNDDAVVRVNAEGVATTTGKGDTHIVAFYDNGVAAVPVLRPYSSRHSPSAVTRNEDADGTRRVPATLNPIDQFVDEKLAKLGIAPSEPCTDAEFLRRVSIDMTGTLPSPEEVTAFLADDAPDKRDRKVLELLERPSYAAWWANKLCDFTGCSPTAIENVLGSANESGQVKASQWYDWIYRRVADNVSYVDLVEGIMLADISRGSKGRGFEMSMEMRTASPAGFARAERMPYFWARQSLQEPKDAAISVAHSFLGIQLQCAECHKHPFDQWTQADFIDFSRFFETVTPKKLKKGSVSPASSTGERDLSLLRSHVVSIAPNDDPRQPIMDWMRDANNPWFARAFVNRIWASYFHIAIVDPPDQFTPANPPSNPRLLEWLTRRFIESGYDMKWVHKQIATSETYQRSWKPNDTNSHDRRNYSRIIPRRIPAEVVYDAMKQVTAASSEIEKVQTNLKRRASGHLSMRMAGTHAMKVFGKPERAINCDCERVNEPTLLQAVFVQNDPLVRMRLADSGWIAEVEAAGTSLDRRELIKQVWLRTVNRPPTDNEVARASQHLSAVDSVSEGAADLLWAMMNTKEFLLNH